MPLWFTLLAAVVVFELACDFSAATFATTGQRVFSVVAVMFAIAANLTFQAALRNGAGLARGGTFFGVSVALGAVIIGVAVFGEKLTPMQIVGITLGLGAILCLT